MSRNPQEMTLEEMRMIGQECALQVVREPKPAAERMAARMRFCTSVSMSITLDPSISDDVRKQIAQIPPAEIEKYKLVDVDGAKKLVLIDDRESETPTVSPA